MTVVDELQENLSDLISDTKDWNREQQSGKLRGELTRTTRAEGKQTNLKMGHMITMNPILGQTEKK